MAQANSLRTGQQQRVLELRERGARFLHDERQQQRRGRQDQHVARTTGCMLCAALCCDQDACRQGSGCAFSGRQA